MPFTDRATVRDVTLLDGAARTSRAGGVSSPHNRAAGSSIRDPILTLFEGHWRALDRRAWSAAVAYVEERSLTTTSPTLDPQVEVDSEAEADTAAASSLIDLTKLSDLTSLHRNRAGDDSANGSGNGFGDGATVDLTGPDEEDLGPVELTEAELAASTSTRTRTRCPATCPATSAGDLGGDLGGDPVGEAAATGLAPDRTQYRTRPPRRHSGRPRPPGRPRSSST